MGSKGPALTLIEIILVKAEIWEKHKEEVWDRNERASPASRRFREALSTQVLLDPLIWTNMARVVRMALAPRTKIQMSIFAKLRNPKTSLTKTPLSKCQAVTDLASQTAVLNQSHRSSLVTHPEALIVFKLPTIWKRSRVRNSWAISQINCNNTISISSPPIPTSILDCHPASLSWVVLSQEPNTCNMSPIWTRNLWSIEDRRWDISPKARKREKMASTRRLSVIRWA